jgi:hypothetical protein
MKIMYMCILSIGTMLAASEAQASNPCETLICMAGMLEGQSGGSACEGPISDYFSIIEYGKHWRFSPGATVAARLNFLNSCGAGVGDWPSQINAVYGAMLL